MAASPRIITVDTTGSIAHIVRAACQLLDQPIILTDVNGGHDALDEIRNRSCTLLVTAVELGDEMKGYELAMQARQADPNLGIFILADIDDPEWDEETIAQSPFVYMHRPVDLGPFVKALLAGIQGEDMLAAMAEPASSGGGSFMLPDMGPIPRLDAEVARGIIDTLLTDVGAMAIVLSSRDGQVLLERGAVGYLDREQLTSALLPMVNTTVAMGEMVGGRASTVHFYDGETYDVYVLSIGLHHFLSLVFDGQAGNRQFGSVNRFGRRAAEDLIALMGTAAYTIQNPQPPARERKRKTETVEQVENAEGEDFAPIPRSAESPPPEPEEFKLEPISDLDLSIFDELDNVNPEDAEALFDLDNLLDVANENRRQGGSIGFDEAQQLGILPSLDNNNK